MKFDRRAMIDWFSRQAKLPENWSIGLESERFAVFSDSCLPLPYSGGNCSVRAVLERLISHHGLQRVDDGKYLLSVKGEHGTVTIEPGSQMEIALLPQPDLETLALRLAQFHAMFAECAEALGFSWLALGVQPFAASTDLAMIPKRRYVLMKEYFNHRGRLAHEMMRTTSSVQISLDFRDEDHFSRMFRVAHALAPLAVGWFGNSWFSRSVSGDDLNKRSRIWTQTDDDRCGPVPGAVEGRMGFAEYTDWLLDVPMIFCHPDRDGHDVVAARGVPFREFADALGREPEERDFVLHQTCVFPLARLKSYVEIRCCDGLPAELLVPVATFWSGLLYSGRALAEVEERIDGITAGDLTHGMEAAIRFGLGAPYLGRTLREWALDLADVAAKGLETSIGPPRVNVEKGRERLSRLRRLAENDESLSGELRRMFGLKSPDPSAVLAARGMNREVNF